MATIIANIPFELGKSLQEQTSLFQAWFGENVKVELKDFETKDDFGRPLSHATEYFTVRVEYFSESINWDFKQYIIE